MLLMATLFPEPVEPAISRCGILVKSEMKGLPLMSFPRARGRGDLLSWKALEEISSLK